MRLRLALAGLAVVLAAETPLATGLDGQPVDPFAGEARAVVLIFVRSDCPISNRYAPEIRRIAAKFGGRGARFWLVYPDSQARAEDIQRHIAEYRLPGGVLRDPRRVLVKLARAEVTSEAAVFAPGERLVYHGRIDDRYIDFGRTRPAATTHDLEAAVAATLDGRRVVVPATPAVGCFLSDVR